MLFGPDQLPRVVRKVGQFTREVQNTSQSFIREMERAADVHEVPPVAPAAHLDFPASETYEPFPLDPGEEAWHPTAPPVGEKLAEPRPAVDDENAAAVSVEPFASTEPPPDPDPAVRPSSDIEVLTKLGNTGLE